VGSASGGQAWYSVREVAGRLGVHPETVRRLIHSNRLAAVRDGRALRVSADSVAELLQRQRRKPERQ
jgi:excisionase family DNA binding protein